MEIGKYSEEKKAEDLQNVYSSPEISSLKVKILFYFFLNIYFRKT